MIDKNSKIFSLGLELILSYMLIANAGPAQAGNPDELQKLAEYDFSTIDGFKSTSNFDSSYDDFYLRGIKYIVASKALDNNSIKLTTTEFSQDFKKYNTFNAVLPNVRKGNFTNSISINNNDHVVFLVVKSESLDANGRIYEKIKKNYISYNAKNWQKLDSLPGLEDFHLRHISNSVIIADCKNTDSYPFLKKVYSLDDGLSWHKFDFIKISGKDNYCENVLSVRDNFLYVKCRNNGVLELYVADILHPGSLLQKINIPTKIITKKNDQNLTLDLNHFETYTLGKYVFARGYYWAYSQKQQYVNKWLTFISKDNGSDWQMVNLNFDKQMLQAIDVIDDFFYLITATSANSIDSELSKHLTGDDLRDKLSRSKVYLYKLTEQQLLSEDKSSLSPVFVLHNAINMTGLKDFVTSKILEIDSLGENGIKVGFYKLN